MKKSLLLFLSFLFTFSIVNAQSEDDDLQNMLSKLSQDAVQSYVSPVISGFGSNLNSGWVSGAPSATILGVNIEVKILFNLSFFNDNQKSFNSSGQFRFTDAQAEQLVQNSGLTGNARETAKQELLSRPYNVSISGPTIIGIDNEDVQIFFEGDQSVQGVNSQTITLDGVHGFLNDVSLLPSAAIQLGLGTVYGTDLKVRFLPSIDISDLGEFSYFGIGVAHNPAVWLAPLSFVPVDLAVSFFYTGLKVGDIFESSATQFGLYASRQFGFGVAVIPYLGLTVESSTTTINYDYEFSTPAGPQTINTSLDLEGENSVGITLGANFKLGFFNIFADYKIASTNTATGGISFGF